MVAVEAAAEALARCDAEASGEFKFIRDVSTDCIGPVGLQHKDGGDGGLGVYRVTKEIRGDVASVSAVLWDTAAPTRDHSRLLAYEVVEELDENTRVIYEKLDMPWPLDTREFVYVQVRRQVDDVFTFCGMSVDHPKHPMPGPDDKLVRGDLWASIQVTAVGSDRIRVVNTGCINPKGDVPTTVLEFFTDRMAVYLEKMQMVQIGQGRRFKVVTGNGIGLRNSASAKDRVTKDEAKEFGSQIPGGFGLPEGAEIQSLEIDGSYPHKHTPAWIRFHVSRVFGEGKSFWVPSHAGDGRELLQPVPP